LQTPIRTGPSFVDLLNLAVLHPIVLGIVARVQPWS
jgi:hypothetical protein